MAIRLDGAALAARLRAEVREEAAPHGGAPPPPPRRGGGGPPPPPPHDRARPARQ